MMRSGFTYPDSPHRRRHGPLGYADYDSYRPWLRIIDLAERYDRPLYNQLLGFPDDLPDLAPLRPPGCNSRPEGIRESSLAKRERGELPPTY